MNGNAVTSYPEINGNHSINTNHSTSTNSKCCQCQTEVGETTRLLSYCCEHSGGQSTAVSSTNEPSTRKRMTKRQITLLILIAYGNFWIGTCYSLLAPFFPQEAEKKGASPTIYGFIFGVFQLALFITSPIFGKVMPIATSRFLLVSGMFVSGSCSVLFGSLYYSPPDLPFIVSAFAVRVVEAIGSSAYYVAALTIASSEFVENRATILSLLESATGIGLIVGPTVGGALYEIGGYTLPFFVLGGIIMVGAPIAAIVAPYSEEKEESGNLMELMSKGRLYICWISFMFCFFVIGYNEATLAYHLKQFNLSPFVLGSVFIIPGGLYALGAPIWGFLCDKFVKPDICGFIGSIAIVVSFLFIGPAPFLGISTKLWIVIVSLVSLGAGLGGMMISSFVLAINNSVKEGLPNDVSTYGLVSGVFTSIGSLGAFIGPSVGGVMIDHIGYGESTVIVFGLSLLMVMILLIHNVCSCSRAQNEENQPLFQA